MSILGSHPMQSFTLNNHTIAASMGGTAAGTTVVSSISATYGVAWQVFNLTLRNLELVIGPDIGTTAIGIFCPGNTTTAGINAGMGLRAPIALQPGMKIYARTTENTPITCSSTTPLVITLWG